LKAALITGGCGFIGSHFVRGFLKSHPDWKVINLDKLTYAGNRENLRDCESHPHYQFVQGDICDAPLVQRLMEQVEAVVHFAAETHVDRSIENADDFLMTNIFGTRVLLDAAKKCGIKRFVHISTDEVYGSIASGHVKEDAPLMPNSPYSAAKAGSDLMARAYWVTYKVPVMVTRSSNNYGPNQFPEKVIPLFITNLIEGKKVPLYGKGENRRDWIFVEDNCRAVELVFDKGAPGEIYNIGVGHELSNLELTHTILKEMGAGHDRINPVADRLGHDLRYGIDVQKITALGFKPQRTFLEGLKETILWYRQHPEWWQPLKQDRFTIK
jgi:dTDP-glucose 4,6-dehydratase